MGHGLRLSDSVFGRAQNAPAQPKKAQLNLKTSSSGLDVGAGVVGLPCTCTVDLLCHSQFEISEDENNFNTGIDLKDFCTKRVQRIGLQFDLPVFIFACCLSVSLYAAVCWLLVSQLCGFNNAKASKLCAKRI